MTSSTLRAPGSSSSTQLLTRILDAPELLAAVRTLPSAALASLIAHVGLEDAGELVALASSEQLEQILDEDLWLGSVDGPEEQFDARRFGLWLAVLAESGDDALVARLVALPEDLLALAVQRAALVLDVEALTQRALDESDAELADKVLDSSLHEPWEELVLVARDPDSWDVVWHALTSLDRDHHDLVRRVLERCAYAAEEELEGHEGLHALLSEVTHLEGDVSDARDERRAGRGYVSSADARAFLALADLPPDESARDAVTRAYFRRLSPEPIPPSSRLRVEAGAGGGQARVRALLGVLREAGVVEQPAQLLAPGGGNGQGPGLRAQMASLAARDLGRYAERLDELSYLANVLLAAARAHEPLRPIEALEVVVTVCDAALAGVDEGAARIESLPAEKLFLRGLRVLRQGTAGGEGAGRGRVPAWLLASRA